MKGTPMDRARATHRFIACPAQWCHVSWLDRLRAEASPDRGLRPTDARALAQASRLLIERFVAPDPIDPAMCTDRPVTLATLPASHHRSLLVGLGLRRLAWEPEVAAPRDELLDGVWRSADGLIDAPREVRAGLLGAEARIEAAHRAGSRVLAGMIGDLAPAVRSRWMLRLDHPPAPAGDRETTRPGALATLAERIAADSGWGGIPCW